jgi:cellulose synthase/poly-beta-1,6-N-acetylglucosamine synthase-like glycosyltransferase
MPKLTSSSNPVIETEPGAHHYRFVGIEITPARGTLLNTLVELGKGDETSPSALPHHIIFDRCYLHGDPARGTRRGVALNSSATAVVNSYVSDFKVVGADSQAIAGWNGTGPFTIANNYLEAAGENVMFGGADPSIRGLVPADIEVIGNHLSKPLRWKVGDPAFEGQPWDVKNLFELKNARRVLVDRNVFEYNWPHAQNGFAILFTPRNQDGRSPWSAVQDVTFSNNLVRHVGAGINVLGRDDIHRSEQTRRIAIVNNLFLDIGGRWGTGRLFQLLDGTADVTIDHNTAVHTGSVLAGGDGAPHTAFVFQNNIVLRNEHGITGSDTAEGMPTLARYFPNAVVRGNLIVGGSAERYPPENVYPPSLADVGFFKGPDGAYGLTLAERYRHSGTNGADPGADIDGITRATTAIGSAPAALATARGTATRPAAGRSLPWAATALFWMSLTLLAYVYFGYPLVAWFRAMLRPKPHQRAAIEPSVSIVIVAHNEADRIEARIENLLQLDYPQSQIEIVIGSDGSTDDTVGRAQQYESAGVKIRAFRQWRGKPSVLNDLVPHTSGSIVVFADARQTFDPQAVRALVADFADPAVGAVSGELILTVERPAAAAEGQGFYWRYETFIRSNESRAGSTVGATGAIYGIRRELFEPIPGDTILDDVLIPLRVIRRGYRVLFEPEARAYDRASPTTHHEWVRKVRTSAGNFQLFAREPWLFNPARNCLWLEAISHKACRLVIPIFQVTLLATNLALIRAPFYQWILAAQLCFYAAALVGHLRRRARRRPIVLTVPYTICLMGWATCVGFYRFVTHGQHVTWGQTSPTRVTS